MSLFGSIVSMELAIRKMREIAPPSFTITVSETMIPWLGIMRDCVAANAKPEDVRRYLEMAAVLDPPEVPQ